MHVQILLDYSVVVFMSCDLRNFECCTYVPGIFMTVPA